MEEEDKQLQIVVGPNQEFLNTIKKVCHTFSEIPPSLTEIAGENDSLELVAEAIHKVLSPSSDTTFSPEELETIEYAFRTFSFNLRPASKEDETEVKDRAAQREECNEIKSLTQELADAREESRLFEEKILKLEKENQGLKSKLEKSQAEGKEYFEKCNQSDERVSKIRHENAQQQKELKQEIDNLFEEKQSLIAKLKTEEFSTQRLTKSLDIATQENAQINAELVKLRSKSQAKTKKLRNAVEDVSTLRLRSEELEAENQRLLTDQNDLFAQLKDCQEKLIQAGPENVKNLEEERDGYKETVEKLQQELDEKTVAYVAARREQLELTKQLNEREAEIIEGTERAEKAEEENAQLKTRIQELNDVVDDVTQQIEQSKKDMTAMQSTMILRSIPGDKAEKSFMSKKGVEERECTMLEGTDEDLYEQNKRLVCIIENQLRFLSSSVVRGLFDPKLISPDAASQPLNEDQGVIDNLYVEIARTKQFIRTECKSNQTQRMTEEDVRAVLDEIQNGADLEQREAFGLIALLSTNNDILRRYCDTILSQNRSIVSQITTLFDANSGEPIEDMVAKVVEEAKLVKQFAKRIQLILNGEFDGTNIPETLEFVTKYCQGTSIILRDFDTTLRETIHFEGELADMPEFACQCFNEIRNMITEAKEEGIKGTRNQVLQLRREMDNEREKAADQIAELEKKKQELETENELLNKNIEEMTNASNETTEKLSVVTKEKKEAEEKVKSMFRNYTQLEEDLEEAKQETEEMRKQMNQKQQTFEERLDAIISDERKQHTDDLLRFEEKLKAREERLKLEINTKSQNLAKTKQKLKQVIEAYDKAFKQQKETTAALRQQNNELLDRLKIAPESRSPSKLAQGAAAAQVEKLKARLRNMEQERELLQAELRESEAKAEKIQVTCTRDIELKVQEKDNEIEEVRKSDEEKRIEIENKLIADIADSLLPYSVEGQDTESVINAVKEIARNLVEAQKEIETLKQHKAIKAVPDSNNTERIKQISGALQEWDRWARDLYVNVTDGQIPKQSTRDLRYALSEMVLASIGHRKLIWRLESLRTQKQALTSGLEIPEKSTPPPTTRATILTIMGAVRILRKAGRLQSVFN